MWTAEARRLVFSNVTPFSDVSREHGAPFY